MSNVINKADCPSCQRPLISRLSDVCQYCGHVLPAELCLSAPEKEAYQDEQAKLRKEDRERSRRIRGGNRDAGLPGSFDFCGDDGGDF